MKIVAVTACPTGIAHTYMSQEAIERECKKRGHQIKVETQGSMGTENKLSQEEIDAADVVILAIGIGIDGDEKRDNGKVIEANPSLVIKDPGKFVDQAEQL